MKKIVIGTTEIEVKSLTPFAYTQAKGEKEKVLRIEVAAEVATFEQLRAALEGATDPVQYKEDDALVCEYAGYGVFSAQYKDGVYTVELHKTSLVEQMSALLVANEKLNKANTALTQAAEALAAQNEALAAQNALHDATLAEVLEVILPATLEELWGLVLDHDERLTVLEENGTENTENETENTENETENEETETAAAAEGDTVTE